MKDSVCLSVARTIAITGVVTASLAGFVIAQTPAPAPPALPAPGIAPAPAARRTATPRGNIPVPPRPAVAPVAPAHSGFHFDYEVPEIPEVPEMPAMDLDGNALRAQMDMMKDQLRLDAQAFLPGKAELADLAENARDMAQRMRDDAQADAEWSKLLGGAHQFKFETRGSLFDMAQSIPPRPPFSGAGAHGRGGSDERAYRRGTELLDQRQWDQAIQIFDSVIDSKGAKADGAYYWKAYALTKQGQADKAIAAVAELQRSYPNSRWLSDAKALEVEAKQAKGQPVSPEAENDEELKLLAINSLINNDPERAIPMLEKILHSHNSPRVKERALFVLASTKAPQARNIVVQFAKGNGNPDLQAKSVEYLGIYGGKENIGILNEIYSSASDLSLKRSILRSFMRAGDKDRLLAVARGESNLELRIEAIRMLGALNAQAELSQMYSAEPSAEVKETILSSLAAAGNTQKLLEIAKSDKDPKLRASAIRYLGSNRHAQSTDALTGLYGSETEKGNKEQILRALYHQGSARDLVTVARRESDPELKREAVRMLSNMKDKDATDFLVELLNK